MVAETPLGLPEGSVRALLAIIALVGAIAMQTLGMTVPEYLQTLVAMMIAFYFGGHMPVGTKKIS